MVLSDCGSARPGFSLLASFLLRLVLFAVIASSGLSAANANEITWVQTVDFSLDARPTTVSRHEGVPDFTSLFSVEETEVFSFGGALPRFTVGEVTYVLNSVKAEVNSAYANNFVFAGYDCCVLSQVDVGGASQSSIGAGFSFEPPADQRIVQTWSEVLNLDCWVGGCTMDYEFPTVVSNNLTQQWSWVDTSAFTRGDDIALTLSKQSYIQMTHWNNESDWSEFRNPMNHWAGSVSLEYSYLSLPAVPEPGTGPLLMGGLLAVFLLQKLRTSHRALLQGTAPARAWVTSGVRF